MPRNSSVIFVFSYQYILFDIYKILHCIILILGTNITTVFASDADKTHPNNQLSYFIEKGGSDQFTINGQTGELSVQVGANLDREIQSSYTLTVIAIDKGYPQNTGTTSVFISLIDENDTPPRWLNLPNTTTVPENATDPAIFLCKGDDSDLNPTLIYSMMIKEASDSDGKPVNLSLIRVRGINLLFCLNI